MSLIQAYIGTQISGLVPESETLPSACLKQAMMFGEADANKPPTPLQKTYTAYFCCYPACSAFLSANWVEQTVC